MVRGELRKTWIGTKDKAGTEKKHTAEQPRILINADAAIWLTPMVTNRTFCDDGNVLCTAPHMIASYVWLVST